MIPKIVLLSVVLRCSLLSLAGSHPEHPAALDVKLHARVHNYQLEAGNFVEALTRVAGDFQIPIGIEWVNTPRARARVSLSWKDATIEEVLQVIAKTQSGFQILVGPKAVRVWSRELIPDRENPLKVKIKAFNVQDVPTELAWRLLHEIVQQTISPPKERPAPPGGIGIAGSGATNVDDSRISVRLKNASVEDALDTIASASARKIWVVTFSDNRGLTAAGYRRTLGLWNPSPVPDDQQPVWDMFHWGDAIPATVLGSR